MKKIALRVCAVLLGAALFLVFWLPGQFVVPVVMYHSIALIKTEEGHMNAVSPESFDRQMRFLKENGYRVLTVDEYVDGVREKKKFPPRSVLITFDDGILNNWTDAYPVLRKYGFPAAMFIPSAFVNKDRTVWGGPELHWDQLRDMSAHGITIGSHTVTHQYLPNIDLQAVRRELVDSKAALEKGIGQKVEYLAYPIGGFSEEIKELVRKAGYKAAFTTNRGYDRLNRDLYALRRIRLKDTDGPVVLWLKLSGYYNLVRSPKRGF